MSVSENLFRVTKHINTFIISKDCSMRVYDIIKLKEALDIRSVSGGFEIFDTENGRRAPGTIIYPDEGSAETTRDRLRAAAPRAPSQASPQPAPQATPPSKPPVEADDLSTAERRTLRRTGSVTVAGQTYTQQEIDNFTRTAQMRRQQALRDAGRDNDPRRERLKARIAGLQNNGRAAFTRSWRQFISPTSWVRGVTSSAGVSTAVWQTLEERMYELYVQHNLLPPDDPMHLTKENYDYAVAAYYSFWAATTILPTLKAGLRTAQVVSQIIRGIRAANLSAAAIRQGISAATGPGFFAAAAINVIWLIASELSFYYATRALLNSEATQKAFAQFIVSWIGKDIFAFAEIAQQELGKFLAPAIGTFSAEKARQAEQDIRDLTNLNPDDAYRTRDEQLRAQGRLPRLPNGSTAGPSSSGGAQSAPAAGASNANGSTAGPTSSAAPNAAPSAANLGIAPQFR